MTYPVTASPVDKVLAVQERFTVVPATVADGVLAGLTVAAREPGFPLADETNFADAAEGIRASPMSRQWMTRDLMPSPPFPAGAGETPLPGMRRARCTTT
jgi:hypothetical protein